MDNASKALIMAASILIGIIILTIAGYLFTSFGHTSREVQEKVDTRIWMEFNNNFTKYIGSETCTIHDIVNLAKFAKRTNEEMGYINPNDYKEKKYYINVTLYNDDLTRYDEKGLLNLLASKSVKEFIDDDNKKTATLQYYVVDEIKYEKIGEQQRVKSIKFREVK